MRGNTTMKLLQVTSLALALSAIALSPTAASAAEAGRSWTQGAASACAAFAPTQQIRTSSTGVKNAGTMTFYVACGMPGDFNGHANGGAYEAAIVAANRGTTPAKVNCTLRPGYVVGSATEQGAFPRSFTLAPGQQYWFWFDAASLMPAGKTFGNVNFTCTLPPNVEITHMNRNFNEDVGL